MNGFDIKSELLDENFLIKSDSKAKFKGNIVYKYYYTKQPTVDEDGDLVVQRKDFENFFEIEQSCSTKLELVGQQLWRGALLLADFLLFNFEQFKGKTILELGSGVGLSSIVASQFAKTICTDINIGNILDLIKSNFLRNKHLTKFDYKILELDFNKKWSNQLISLIDDVEIVLAADVYCANDLDNHGVVYANECEVCKILAIELEDRLKVTGRSHDVIETGYSVDQPKKRKEYKKSELRLVESLENVCDQILLYNVHKEREDSTRFAKGMSQTFQTLHGLVDKGVKVELGIPYELWDKPSAEITEMKSRCEKLLEIYESDIEDWYFKHEHVMTLTQYLCENIVLKNKDQKCLNEILKGDIDDMVARKKQKTANKNEL